MNPDPSAQKKEALRLAFLYPGVFLGIVIVFGAIASVPSKIDPHAYDNAVRGMTALSLLAFSLALLGYMKVKKCL